MWYVVNEKLQVSPLGHPDEARSCPGRNAVLNVPPLHHNDPRPKIGFLSFVDVVVQGGEVVARLHLVTLPPNHVGQAGALAGVLGAAIVQCPSKVTVTGSTSVQVIA